MSPHPNILVIDDDRFFTRLAHRLADRSQLSLEECNDAMQLNPQRLGSFDVIVLDIMMPGVDGVQMLNSIRMHAPKTGVVLMTSIDQSVLNSITDLALGLGVQLRGVLHKPFKNEEFLALVSSSASQAAAVPEQQLQHVVGNPGMSPSAVRTMMAEHRLRVLLQPQVSLSTGKWLGCQAIPYLQTASGLQRLPPAPIRAHDQPLLAIHYTLRVLELAINQAKGYCQEPAGPLSMSVFIQASLLEYPRFPQFLRETLDENGFPCRQLVLELADAEQLQDTRVLQDNLRELRQQNIRLSLNCTGTSAETITRISNLHFDELKLDRSLVFNLSGSLANRQQVKQLLDTCSRLCIPSVADSITDGDTQEWLRVNGCDIGQGDFLATPMNAEGLLQWHRLESERH